MAKPNSGPWVLRSLLFVPGHMRRLMHKAAGSEADCVVLDLQDAVPDSKKEEARSTIRTMLEDNVYENNVVFVRVNPLESGLTLQDVSGVACRQLHGFVYAMAYTPEDITAFDAQLELVEANLGLEPGHFSIIVLIETPLAVINAYPIAKASRRVVGLLFGCEDFLAEIQGRHSESDMSLHTPRAQVVLACRSAGVEPIDTPYVKVHDTDGLKLFAQRARDLGMAGMLVMSPRQIPVAHEVYTPSEAEISLARRMVQAADEADREGRPITVVDEMFVSPPTLKAARNLLARAEAIRTIAEVASMRRSISAGD